MVKRIFFSLICIYFLIHDAKAQTYDIESFEGTKTNINLYYKPSSGMLTISCLKDTIMINNYMSVENVKVLNKVFLQINYVKRAGTNENFMNQILLYVHNGKLCQSLHINSLTTYDMRNVYHIKNQPSEYALFKAKVDLIGHNANTYELRVNIHDESISDRNLKSNYNYNKTIFLDFDKTNYVFYNSHEYTRGYFMFHKIKNNSIEKEYIEKDIPVIKIKKDKYFYVNGDWYTKDKNSFYSQCL